MNLAQIRRIVVVEPAIAVAVDAVAAAAALAAEESEPFTDGVASEWYRRRMVKVQVGRALSQISQ